MKITGKEDLRIQKTMAGIHAAFEEMICEMDYDSITVKELCQQAGVNRSTFYLHYENLSDLLAESMETINQRFLSYFSLRGESVLDQVHTMELEDLVFVTREYLLPYLRFIRDNKKVYRAAFRNPSSMQVQARYDNLKRYILGPILERFEIPAAHRPYYMAYYIEGIAAIVKEWLRQDCADEVEMIADIIESCVRPKGGIDGK